MPYLSELIADPEALPISYLNVNAADVAIAAAGTYYEAASLGTIPAGTYRISANVSVLNGAGAAFVNSKVFVGAVAYAPTETSCIATGACMCSTPEFTINIPVAAVVRVMATATTATGSIKTACVNGGANTGATWICALRVK
jgi:hypothetical protein